MYKSLSLVFTVSLLLTTLMSYGQDDAEDRSLSRFSLIGYGGIGFVKVENDEQANYNLDANTGELLVNYRLSKSIGIATGIGLTELSGSGFNDESIFYHERSLFKIPLVLTSTQAISDKLKAYASFGAFGQTIIKDDYRYFNGTIKDLYEGWTFGVQFGLGIAFELNPYFSFGINFSGQSELTKVESTNNASFNDKQKLTNINTLGIFFIWDL